MINPRLKTDLLLILIPGVLWFGALSMRPTLIGTRCAERPQTCTQESLFPMDQFSVGMEDWKADQYSFFTQNLSGALALAIPTGWNIALTTLGKVSPTLALSFLGADLVTLLQTVTWNGFLTEASHFISQRPRPFVYSDPSQRGADPAHYTSFYSGHTSFAAAANTALFLILWSRNAPLPILILVATLGESLVISTAYFRVLAGRHFLTDVIAGALAGTFVALIVARYRRKRSPQESFGPELA